MNTQNRARHVSTVRYGIGSVVVMWIYLFTISHETQKLIKASHTNVHRCECIFHSIIPSFILGSPFACSLLLIWAFVLMVFSLSLSFSRFGSVNCILAECAYAFSCMLGVCKGVFCVCVLFFFSSFMSTHMHWYFGG